MKKADFSQNPLFSFVFMPLGGLFAKKIIIFLVISKKSITFAPAKVCDSFTGAQMKRIKCTQMKRI
ncbi:MAG: hypothetical protein IKO26_08170 [Paludibacteraceae bacterium]|nr:hypothetical protein [Paludibacteraceae bacterium]